MLKFKRFTPRHLILIVGACLFLIAFFKAYRFFRSIKAPTTEAVTGSLSVAAMNWEFWTLMNKKNGDSFSAVLRKLGRVQTFIPFIDGMRGEHLWAGDPITLEAYRAGQAAGKYWPLLDREDLEEAKKA